MQEIAVKAIEQLQAGKEGQDISEQSRRAIQEGKIPDPREGQMPDKHQQEISRALLPEDYQKELDVGLSDKSEDWTKKLLPDEGDSVKDVQQDAVRDELSVRDTSEKLAEQDIKGIGVRNKQEGTERENKVFEELKTNYPEDQGYKIHNECYIRDKSGNIIKDTDSGEARRIDFVVTKDGKSIESVEVTSPTAPKDKQIEKESRIRDNGGNYIKDTKTNEIIPLGDINTEIWRRAL